MARCPQTKQFFFALAASAPGIFATANGAQIENKPWPFAPRTTPAPAAIASTPAPISTPAGSASSGTPAFAAPSKIFGTPAPPSDEPPRNIPLVEVSWDALSDKDLGKDGKTAMTIKPEKWRHAETENFILHFRRITEAAKVAREVEYDLWFVAKTLGAKKEQYHRKSHVYIFEDEEEWHQFLPQTSAAPWAASFAHGDELFLNVREATGRLDSDTLAHETTHAVVARLYPRKRWPVWLNEGFAEYMGGASVAARKGQTVGRHQSHLRMADMPLEEMEKLTAYPTEQVKVAQLYQTGEKLMRFLMDEMPREKLTRFIDAALSGLPLKTCLLGTYGEELKTWDDFERRFARFAK